MAVNSKQFIQGAIFDCDGTLLDSLGVWHDLEAYLAREAGVVVTPEERALLATFTIPEVAAFFHEQYGLGTDDAEVMRMMNTFMLDYYQHRAVLLPGVRDFLQECADAGIIMSVASSSPPEYLEAGLTCAGIRDYFCAVVSVDEVGASKREPAVYHRACQLMGTSPELTWGFEDSAYALATLRAAGYKTVGIYDETEGCTFADLQSRCDIAIQSFAELSLASFGA